MADFVLDCVIRRLVLLLFPLLGLLLPASSAAAEGTRLRDARGNPMFVIGMNYEGPVDRAWQMWENGKFDVALIEADFKRATSAGANALRIFVQAPLAADIAADRWDKLDQVVALAERYNVRLIVSLHDYAERDLGRVTATAERVAQRYRGRPGILAYDLKNEPRFNDISLTRYPGRVALQERGLVDALGERMPKEALAEYRASEEGARTVPSAMSEDDAWIYVNNLSIYRDMLAEASVWVRERGFRGTTLDYLDDAAGKKWAPLTSAMDNTLRAWLTPQVQAIARADPGRPITVHHVDPIMARLPSNEMLDVHTLHRYPATGAASVRAALSLLGSIQRAFPGTPHLLGEFGYATESLDPDRAALHEVAIYLGLLAQGAGGGAKWMLNDMPSGFNMRERTLGAFRQDGSAKPVVSVLAALREYLDRSPSAAGDVRIEDDADVGLRYVYRASDALLLGGKQVDGGAARMSANGAAHLFLSWTSPEEIRLWSSGPLQATLDLSQLVGPTVGEPRLVRLQGGGAQPVSIGPRNGDTVTLNLDRAGSYELEVELPTTREPNYAISGGDGHFFTQTNGRERSATGFSVTNQDGIPFWETFQSLGGVDVLGYPVTRRFDLDGFIVQAFQKIVLQWRPDQGNRSFFLNTFDVLHDRGKDEWLDVYRQVPRPFDNAADGQLAWDGVVARHLAFLEAVPPPLRERFLSNPRWLDHYGLPVATFEYPNSVVVRAQRATFQYWKVDVPWAKQGEISVANGGDLAKEAELWPRQAATPENPPR